MEAEIICFPFCEHLTSLAVNITDVFMQKPEILHRKIFRKATLSTTIDILAKVHDSSYFKDQFYGKRRDACLELVPRKIKRLFCHAEIMKLLTLGAVHNISLVFYDYLNKVERNQFHQLNIHQYILNDNFDSNYDNSMEYFQEKTLYFSHFSSRQGFYCNAGSGIKPSFDKVEEWLNIFCADVCITVSVLFLLIGWTNSFICKTTHTVMGLVKTSVSFICIFLRHTPETQFFKYKPHIVLIFLSFLLV